MQNLPIALQSRTFIYRQGAIISVGLVAIVLFMSLWVIWITFAFLATMSNIFYSMQQHQIEELQHQLLIQANKESEYIMRTEQLRRALHDIRSPISALGLRIHILQRNSDEEGKQHLEQMKKSLDSAIGQVQTISDIQHGKVEPTETMILRVKDIQARAGLVAD